MKLMSGIITAALLSTTLHAQIADGDRHYANRAAGSSGARAQNAEIDAAVGAYRRAIAQNANDLEARWKLLRALRFKAAYTVSDVAAKREIYGGAKKNADEMLVVLQRQAGSRVSIQKDGEKKVADALRSVPGSSEALFWDSVIWGEWAVVYGKMAAVRQGAADRIKRNATLAMMINPAAEGGGGARVLGRLHSQTPRVPFVTGWASDAEAVRFLRQSLSHDRSNKLTRVFLAEAMVAVTSKEKPQAIQMLKAVISEANDPAFQVEDAAAKDDARALLKTL